VRFLSDYLSVLGDDVDPNSYGMVEQVVLHNTKTEREANVKGLALIKIDQELCTNLCKNSDSSAFLGDGKLLIVEVISHRI
jgi:hypothetical protein